MLVPLRQMLYPQYVGGHSGDFVDYGTVGERAAQTARKPTGKKQKKIAAIVERIAEAVTEQRISSTEADIELILRLRLEQEQLIYKTEYLILLMQCIRRERYNKAIILLLLTN